MNISNALDLSGIKINLLSKLKPDLLLYLLPVTVYLVYINNNRKDNLSIDIRISRSSVIMGICLMILINILNPASIIAQELWSKEDLYNYLSMRNKAEFIEKFGIGSYIRKDIELTASDDSLNKDELNYWIDNNRELSENNEYTDIFATKVELNTSITQTSTSIMTEVNKKVDETEFGTKIEQNAEAVKVAWNQIAEYIQMMIINGNASLEILDDNKKVLMSLDKTGQHFYDSETVFGNMGVKKVGENRFIAFAVPRGV